MKHAQYGRGQVQQGFTVLELVLVLAIVGVLSASFGASVPDLGVSGQNVELERVKMIARIAHARNQAMLLGSATLQVKKDRINYKGDMQPMPGEGQTVTLEAVTLESSGSGNIVFDDYGCCPSGFTLRLVDAGDAAHSTVLTINRAGYVQ